MQSLWASVPILGRLVRRYTAQSIPLNPAEAIPIIPAVVLASDVDELLKTTKISLELNDVDPGGNGYYTLATVPNGKRWYLRGYSVYRSTGANTKVGATAVYSSTSSTRVDIDNNTAADSHNEVTGKLEKLEEGWQLQNNISAYNAGDKITAIVYYDEEDAFQS